MDAVKLINAKELAAMLQVSLRTIRSWDASGRLPQPVRVGSCVRWDSAEIRRWVSARCPARGVWNVDNASR
jgi:predicted DNA-binding transcriptional regulator AlpA